MDKETAKELWLNSLKRDLDPVEKKALDEYILINPEEAKEFQDISGMWETMDEMVPAPTPQMDATFYQFLNSAEKQSKKKEGTSVSIERIVQLIIGKWAYALVLVLGLGIGFAINSGSDQDMESLVSEVQTMKEMMALTLMDQPVAQDRMRAVSMVEELESTDDKVMKALIKTLNEDPSINVRLKVVESLYNKQLSEAFRGELVMSIAKQDNPLVQTALADLMVSIQEKSSVDALKKLLNDENTNPFVKEKINESLQVLI